MRLPPARDPAPPRKLSCFRLRRALRPSGYDTSVRGPRPCSTCQSSSDPCSQARSARHFPGSLTLSVLLYVHLHCWRSHGGAVRALGYRGQRMVSPVTRVPRRAVVGDRASPHLLVPHLLPIHIECDCDSIRSSGVNGGAMRNRLSVCRPGDLSAAKEVGVV